MAFGLAEQNLPRWRTVLLCVIVFCSDVQRYNASSVKINQDDENSGAEDLGYEYSGYEDSGKDFVEQHEKRENEDASSINAADYPSSKCISMREELLFGYSPGNYNTSELTPLDCMEQCTVDSMLWSATTNGDLCLCFDSAEAKPVFSSNCSQLCSGNSSMTCGGRNMFQVYNSSASPRSLDFLQSSKFIAWLCCGRSEDSLNCSYTDISGERKSLTIMPLATNYSGQSFTKWDNQFLAVISEKPSLDEYQHIVQPDHAFHSAELQCPSYVEVNTEFSCNGTFGHGRSRLNYLWTLGNLSGEIVLADPVQVFVGFSVPYWRLPVNSVALAEDGLIILISSRVTSAVHLFAVELNANSSGNLQIVILRPQCEDEFVFCSSNDSCCSANDEAPLSQECYRFFCSSPSVCRDPENQACPQYKNSYKSQSLQERYEVAYTFTINVDFGYNLRRLPDRLFEYRPGDVLAWHKASGTATLHYEHAYGAYHIVAAGQAYDNLSLGASVNTGLSKIKVYYGRFLLAGIASKPVDFLFNLVFPITSMNTQLTIVSPNSSTSLVSVAVKNNCNDSLTTTKSEVQGIYPVGSVSLFPNNETLYSSPNEQFNISLLVSNGTRMVIEWEIPGTNVTIFSRSHQYLDVPEGVLIWQNFTLVNVGTYSCFITVSHIHRVVSNITIQSRISGLNTSLQHPNQTTFKGITTRLQTSVVTGTDVEFSWYFGDGSKTSKTTTLPYTEHAYIRSGLITTTVQARNKVSSENVSVVILVTDPLKMTFPAYHRTQVPLNVSCDLLGNLSHVYKNSVMNFTINDAPVSRFNENTIRHTFISSGLYEVSCSVRLDEDINASYLISVQTPVMVGPSLRCPGAYFSVSDCAVETGKNVVFEVACDDNATNATFSWKWTNISKSPSQVPHICTANPGLKTSCSLNKTTCKSSSFRLVGIYNLSMIMFNNVSSREKVITIYVQESIQNFSVTAPCAVHLDRTFTIEVSLEKGSNVNLFLDFGDGLNFTASNETAAPVTIPKKYNNVGIFNITSIVQNLISLEQKTVNVLVLEILVDIDPNSEKIFSEKSLRPSYKTSINFTFFSGGVKVSSLKIKWADDAEYENHDYHNLSTSHIYESHGKFVVAITLIVPCNHSRGDELVTTREHELLPWCPWIEIEGASQYEEHAPRIPHTQTVTIHQRSAKHCSFLMNATFNWTVYEWSGKAQYTLLRLKSLVMDQPSITMKHLLPGKYKVKLNVTFPTLSDPVKWKVYEAYVKVVAQLSVSISGGKSRTHPIGETLVLKANYNLPKDLLTLMWSCKHSSSKCFMPTECYNQSACRLNETFLEYGDYEFNVTLLFCGEEGIVQASCVQTVKPTATNITASIRCEYNCGATVVNTDMLVLVCDVENVPDDWSLKWDLKEEPELTLEGNTSTTLNDRRLIVKPYALQPGRTYTFRVNVTAGEKSEAFSTYQVIVHAPPYGGNCSIRAAQNGSYTFSCFEWKHFTAGNSPLVYQIRYSDDDKVFVILYRGFDQHTVHELLSPGREDNNYTIYVQIRIEDSSGLYAEKRFDLQVLPTNRTYNKEEVANIIKAQLKSGNIQTGLSSAVGYVKAVNASRMDDSEKHKVFESVLLTTSNVVAENEWLLKQKSDVALMIIQSGTDNLEKTQGLLADALLNIAQSINTTFKDDAQESVVQETCKEMAGGLSALLEQMEGSLSKNEQHAPGDDDSGGIVKRSKALKALSIVLSTLSTKVFGGETKPLKIETSAHEFILEKLNLKNERDYNVSFSKIDGKMKLVVPSSSNGMLSFRAISSNFPLIPRTNSSSNSPTISLTIQDENLRSKVSSVEYAFVPQKSLDDNSLHEISSNTTSSYELLTYHVKVKSRNIMTEVYSKDNELSITVYLHRSKRVSFDLYENVSHHLVNAGGKIRHFIDNPTVFIGIKVFYENGSRAKANSYSLKIMEVDCWQRQEFHMTWQQDTVWVDKTSSSSLVRCLSTKDGETMTYLSFVLPNHLPFSAVAQFAKIHQHPALLITVCLVFGLYILGLVWSRRRDKQNKRQVKLIIPSGANYEIGVFTGSRGNSGTTANIFLEIHGENGASGPHLLPRCSPLSFSRSSHDTCFISTVKSLGALLYVRLWHDNFGSSPSWFLSEIVVRDLAKDDVYVFLCDNWLACDEGDGQIDRILYLSGEDDLRNSKLCFITECLQGFTDKHLWFSIFLSQPGSNFTRVQRLSCCVCILACTMLLNAMFYDVAASARNNIEISLGPWRFTLHDLLVGIESDIIVFPATLVLVTLFRKTASKPLKHETDKNSNFKTLESRKKKKWMLPWWFLFLDWAFLFGITVAAGFFTLLYAFDFGKSRQEKWLLAMLVSTLSDVFISQPVKIFIVSLFVALVFRKRSTALKDDSTKLEIRYLVEKPESILDINIIDMEVVEQQVVHQQNAQNFTRPTEYVLDQMRALRKKEKAMYETIRDILLYSLFFSVVVTIAYGYQDYHSYRMSNEMADLFVSVGRKELGTRGSLISQMTNNAAMFLWIEKVIIPALHDRTWYNNRAADNSHWLSDQVNFLIGGARLRQLRVQKGSCAVPAVFQHMIKSCQAEYSSSTEYRVREHHEYWIAVNESQRQASATRGQWSYRTEADLDGTKFHGKFATYSGGGYVIELDKSVSLAQKQVQELRRTRWVDEQTRAVFVEIPVFNPNTNLYSIATLIFECPASGGCITLPEIWSTKLSQHVGNYAIIVFLLKVAFVAVLLIYTYKAAKEIFKKGISYMKNAWNIIETGIILSGWSCVVFYFIRVAVVGQAILRTADMNGAFVNYSSVVLADHMHFGFVAVVVFLLNLRFLRLLRFNRRTALLGSTLEHAANELLSFSAIFVIGFMACVNVTFIFYQNDEESFSSFFAAAITLLNIVIGKFKLRGVNHGSSLFATFSINCLSLLMVFLLVTVFLSIINDSFAKVRHDNDLQSNQYEVLDFVVARLRAWLGVKNTRSTSKSDFEYLYGFKPDYISHTDKRKEMQERPVVLVRLELRVQKLVNHVDALSW